MYCEIVLAQGMRKDIILTAKEGRALSLDLTDGPTILWKNQRDLKGKTHTQASSAAADMSSAGAPTTPIDKLWSGVVPMQPGARASKQPVDLIMAFE